MSTISVSVYKGKTGATFPAFQWTGQSLTTLPAWAAKGGMHTSDGFLHLNTRSGTVRVSQGDWVSQEADGTANVINNQTFVAEYVVGP